MREITGIVVHCSASPFGDAALINKWHTEPPRNWKAIGYNYVVLNGSRTSKGWDPALIGLIENGRDLDGDGDVDEEVGAHTLEVNRSTIGVCFIGPIKDGPEQFPEQQLRCGARLIAELCVRYNVPVANVKGHNEYPSGRHKECPVLDMDDMRRRVETYIMAGMSMLDH